MPQGQYSLNDIEQPKSQGQYSLADIEQPPQLTPQQQAEAQASRPKSLQPLITAQQQQLQEIGPGLAKGLAGVAIGEGVGALAGAAATRIASKVAATKTAQDFAARVFNKVANVPAGRQGVRVAQETGEIITNPGNAPLRALSAEGATAAQQLKTALTAQPNKELLIKSYGQLQKSGKAIESALEKSGQELDLGNLLPAGIKKVDEALDAAGVVRPTPTPAQPPSTILSPSGQPAIAAVPQGAQPPFIVSARKAQQVRSQLGDRINWNPNVLNEANEEMKAAYFNIGDQIEQSVPNIKPLNKTWQEDYLYVKALARQLEKIGKGSSIPPSFARATLTGAGKKAAIGTGLGGGTLGIYEYLSNLNR